MQPSPVAPSATSPAGPTTAIIPVVLPTPTPVPVPSPQPPREIPTPTPPPTPPSLEIGSVSRIGGTATDQEWRFAPSGDPRWTEFHWDFGDGSGGSSRTEQHIYSGTLNETKTYIVRLSARDSTGLERSVQRTIEVTFK